MTYYCSECVVNWHPYQARNGCCPVCGGGTERQQEAASEDADELYKECVRKERYEHSLALFEEYYAKWETGWRPDSPVEDEKDEKEGAKV